MIFRENVEIESGDANKDHLHGLEFCRHWAQRLHSDHLFAGYDYRFIRLHHSSAKVPSFVCGMNLENVVEGDSIAG